MHPAEAKATLRQQVEQRLTRMSPGERAAESRSLCRRLVEHLPKECVVCAYAYLSTEPDLTLLVDECNSRGQSIFLPCYERGMLTFRLWLPGTPLVRSQIGVLEPPVEAPHLEESLPAVVLVPGRAFDAKGARLGRGNGGYDKWIAQERSRNAPYQYWGVAFECQVVDEVPVEAHDQKLDAVVTARGFETRDSNIRDSEKN